MADRSVRVILSVVATGFSAGMSKAAADTKALTSTLETHKASVDKLANASLVAGGVIAAGVGVAVKAYADFDQQMSRVSATGADAQASLLGLREAALQAGADTKFSATEAAAGVESLLKAGVSAKDVLGGGLAGALSLASAGEMGVADAAEVAATALTQFKLQGSDVGHVADLLAAGAGNAQGEVSDMAMALKQGGLVASQFGLSIDETVGGLTAFASAGLIGSDAGTSFKSMLLALANPSKESSALMSQLGINAYDAGGKFVGLDGLAGQLQSRLSGLTDAQRQQALAQIFGTDAMRAASVLYDQGATGMAGWTAKVNDSGYAARAAAEKMNNLSGDLEQLRGSIETTLIKTGEAANGPLRSLTQNATGLVNALGNIPAPLQALTLGLGGIAGGGLIAVGGITKVVSSGLELKQTMTDLSVLHPKVASGLTSVGKAATIAAGALVALQVASAVVGEDWQQKQTKADDLAHSMLDASVSVNALNGSFQFNDGGLSAQTYDGIGESIKRALDPGAFRSFDDALDGLLGRTSTAGQITAQFKELDTAVSSLAGGGKIDEAARQFQYVASEAEKQGVGIDKLVALFPSYKAQLDQTAQSLGVVGLSTKDYANWMSGSVPPAITAAASAAGTLDASMIGLSKSTADATAQAKEHTQSIRDNANALLQESGSAMGLESAIDAATQSVKDNGTNLDINTEKGRANRGALDQIASSALSLQKAQEATGASTESLNAYTDRARTSFIETATQMGMTGDEAAALADRYGLVPKDVPTSVTLSGASEATLTINGLREAEDALHDKSITISVYYSGANAAGMADAGVLMRASGGPVWGPGSATSDSIPAWLSNGEYVINAASAARLGLDRLHYLNAYGQLPAFASGGQVDSRVHYSQAVPRYAGGGAVSAPSGASSPSGYSVADLRAALSGLTLRIGEVSAVGDYAIGRLYAAATQGV